MERRDDRRRADIRILQRHLQWRADAASGRLTETFACGTAAVVTSVGKVAGKDGEFTIGAGGIGQTTAKLRETLVSIQKGTVADTRGWVMRV